MINGKADAVIVMSIEEIDAFGMLARRSDSRDWTTIRGQEQRAENRCPYRCCR
jgi:hypothetical protein